MLDAAYDAYASYETIRDGGRRSVIDPRRDHIIRGYSARSEMLRWRRQSPEEFERTYRRRSLVESVFSSIKARFGSAVAAKTLPLQRLRLILRSICYNLLFWQQLSCGRHACRCWRKLRRTIRACNASHRYGQTDVPRRIQIMRIRDDGTWAVLPKQDIV